MTIVVHIDRLVMDGIPLAPGSSGRLAAAVEAELGRLLAVGPLPLALRSGGAAPSTPGGSIHVAGGESAPSLGCSIAEAVHGGLRR